MRRYGYIASKPAQYNLDNLPIGFARDGDYVGLTCHTAQFEYVNKIIRIEGGQSGTDMQSFMRDLEAALDARRDCQALALPPLRPGRSRRVPAR